MAKARTITVQVDATEYVELARLRAMERHIGSIFDDWIGSIADLMALYEDDLSWDEVLPLAVEELRELRATKEADQ